MITRLTSGPLHHFFGYYGTQPWNATDQFHLALETSFHEHAPLETDIAAVGVVETASGKFLRVSETRAFNLQQGSMLYWINVGQGEELTHNDWQGGRLVTKAINPRTGKARTINGAIAAVSPRDPVAVGLNYARTYICRNVTGYAHSLFTHQTIRPIPDDDGLFRLDLKTGESRLIVSITDVEKMRPCPDSQGQLGWFEHVIFNTTGSRMAFLYRMTQPAGKRFLDSLWSVDSDGGNLECLIGYGKLISHFAWANEDTLMLSCNALNDLQFVWLTDRTKHMTPCNISDFPEDGHNAFSPDFSRIVCDTYPRGPERLRRLMVHDRKSKETLQVGAFQHPENIKGDWRCDLHPRWSRNGRQVSFDSAHEGSRQIYIADVPAALSSNLNA